MKTGVIIKYDVVIFGFHCAMSLINNIDIPVLAAFDEKTQGNLASTRPKFQNILKNKNNEKSIMKINLMFQLCTRLY